MQTTKPRKRKAGPEQEFGRSNPRRPTGALRPGWSGAGPPPGPHQQNMEVSEDLIKVRQDEKEESGDGHTETQAASAAAAPQRTQLRREGWGRQWHRGVSPALL